MYSPHVSYHRPAPFSTGQHPRKCRVCGESFTGLGTLCPFHLAAHARQRAHELKAQRTQSANIITARAQAARAAQPKRTEVPDELDADDANRNDPCPHNHLIGDNYELRCMDCGAILEAYPELDR